jgi:hypothetical protein
MGDHDAVEARVRLDDAARTSDRVRSAGRWYSRYLVLMGLLTCVLIVGSEAVFPSGPARQVVSATWAIAWVALIWWGSSHAVLPHGGGRRTWIALAVWAVAYLFVVGPLVRWQAGESVGWWTVAALVMASPFFVAARRARRS